ncbi:MAG: aminotransferase class V-fold PLP-dependent enzyme [Candidatus Thermoplasmatota archaeon]|nr:aminotransferase class V-fold PLP-dependent enzyme [Candidatus Thermoplasmatota archaeon]
MKMETEAVHASQDIDPTSRAVNPPINLSTTFERAEDESSQQRYIYSRENNPNRESLEECVARLEEGEAGIAFSSGSAAAMSSFQILSPGDHIICPDDMYHGIKHQIEAILERWGLKTSFVDMTEPKTVKEEIRPDTEMIWIETPSNPLLKITDIEKISEIAHENDALSVCDNTWGTPFFQKPLKLGCDLVVHSTTKYLGGHSDAVGGMLVVKKEDDIYKKIREIEVHGGACPSPFDCWLIRRGIKTLALRMQKHSENAMEIAKFLQEHPGVEKVYYPGLREHPGHEIAEKQMSSPGGMLSFRIRGGKEEALQAASDVKIFTQATSLGSVESLIEHRASVEGEANKTPEDLLRLSVGIEDPEDLIQDLDRALQASAV